MQLRIREPDPIAAQELAQTLSISGATAQILLHRGFGQPDAARAFLSPKLAELTRPTR